MAASPRLFYAGFWLRFLAVLIDSAIQAAAAFILLIPLVMITGVAGALSKMHPGEDPEDLLTIAGVGLILGFIAIVFVGKWLYYALLESSAWQATVGKRVLGLKVTDKEGQRLSFGHATGRFFAKIVSSLVPLGIGYILAGFTEKKQALHDMIAGSLVVRA